MANILFITMKISAYHQLCCVKELSESVRLLVTCLHGKLDAVYIEFKKTEDLMHIYKKTREKADERFQSVYAEAVGLTYKILTCEK